MKEWLMRKIIGYNIESVNDYEMDAVFIDRDDQTVFINFAKLSDLTYVDFLCCVQSIFVKKVHSKAIFEAQIKKSARCRVDFLTIAAKLILLISTASVASDALLATSRALNILGLFLSAAYLGCMVKAILLYIKMCKMGSTFYFPDSSFK